VPIVLIEASDRESLEFAIIENVQRADLNPLEEAAGYKRLAEEFEYDADDIARIVGKSRPHVANTMRLLLLPEAVQAYLRDGRITAGHARMLIGQPNALEFAETIVTKGLNVRQVEAWAKRAADAPARARKRSGSDPDADALAKRLGDTLGLTVKIDHRADGSGTLSVAYRTLEQLDAVVERLAASGAPKRTGEAA
jgi:ParB family transcriptional regulator, chromosome partitioning protein